MTKTSKIEQIKAVAIWSLFGRYLVAIWSLCFDNFKGSHTIN
jgi:hypothetical protein